MVARWIPSLCLFSAPHLFIFTPIARPNCEGPDGRSAEVSEPKLRIWRRSLSQSYEMKSPNTEIFTVMKEERKQETSRFNQPELQLWSELCPDWFSLIGESSLSPDVSWTLRLTDLFRAAAEVGPHHILKMYNTSGGVLNISPQLEANSQDSYYRLEVVASDLKSESCRGHFGKKRCVTNLRSWKINPGCVFVHVQVRGCRQSWTTWRAGECVLYRYCTGDVCKASEGLTAESRLRLQAASPGEQSDGRRGEDARHPLWAEEPGGVLQEEAGGSCLWSAEVLVLVSRGRRG